VADKPYTDDAKDAEEVRAESPTRNFDHNELKDQSLADIYWVLDTFPRCFFTTGIIYC
jgi:hypothetical protein